jgi:hypothetical protein
MESPSGAIPDVTELCGDGTVWPVLETFFVRAATSAANLGVKRASSGHHTAEEWGHLWQLIADVVTEGCPALVNRVFYLLRPISTALSAAVDMGQAALSAQREDGDARFSMAGLLNELVAPMRRALSRLPWGE